MRAVALLVLALAAPVAADPRHSASRDAPVFEYAYGPRAQLSLGRELVIGRFRLALLGALEDARDHGPLPDELGRLVVETGATWALAAWRLGADLGLEKARKIGGVEGELVLDEPRPGDIPHGGGGIWTGVSVGRGLQLSGCLRLELSLRERVFLSGWAILVGRRDGSDYLDDGLAHAPGLDAELVWQPSARVHPWAALFAEGLFPRDRGADASGFARLLVGADFPGVPVAPFVSFDAGAGKGLLINRHELRFSLGVRLVP